MDMQIELNKLTNFLQSNYPNIVPIPTTATKEPMYAFKDKTTDTLWQSWNAKGINAIINGKAEGVSLLLRDDWIVIDFDDKDQAENFETSVPEFQQAPKQETRKGCHFYFRRTSACDANNLFCHIRPFEKIELDILTKRQEGKEAGLISVYPSPNKTWVRSIYDTPLIDLPDKFIDFYNDKCKNKSTKPKEQIDDDVVDNQTKNKIDYEALKEIVDNLADSRADDYGNWSTSVWAIYNIGRLNGYRKKANNLIHEFSSRSSKYDEDEVEEFIERASDKDDALGVGTLMMMLKQDNEVAFQTIQAKLNPIKKIELEGYAFQEEPDIDIFDGQIRDYDIVKQVFEKTHFKVMRPLLYVEELDNGECYMRDEAEIKKTYRNLKCMSNLKCAKFINTWIDDANIKTYNTIDFLPPPLKCPANTYNMWRGFAAERLGVDSSGNVEPILKHIKVLVKHDEKGFDYFIKWLAQLVQQPGHVNRIAVVLKSKQGSGKNRFLDFMHYILGKDLYFETANPVQDLWSRFAVGRKNRVLINIDEASGKDTYPFADQLKNMITSPNFNYEQKGVSPITLINLNRIIFTTNNACPIKIEEGDRRFVVFECSDELKGNTQYFNEFSQYIDDPANQRAFYEYLMKVDISKIDWINDRPITDLYKDIQEANTPIHVKFFKYLVENNPIDMTLRYSGASLFDHFNKFLEQGKYTNCGMNMTSWGRIIKPLIGGVDSSSGFIVKSMSKGCVVYKLDIKSARAWLITNKYMADCLIQDIEGDDEF